MIAYKFLKSGASGLVSGFAWPTPRDGTPGAWVGIDDPAAPVRECHAGVHVCRSIDLPYWMHDELWAIEVEGDAVPGLNMLIAPRGRLLRLLEGWNRAGRTRFVEACRDRAVALVGQAPPERRVHGDSFLGFMDKYLRLECTQLGALCAALAAASTRDDAAATKAAYRQERQWQSEWLVENLDLAL